MSIYQLLNTMTTRLTLGRIRSDREILLDCKMPKTLIDELKREIAVMAGSNFIESNQVNFDTMDKIRLHFPTGIGLYIFPDENEFSIILPVKQYKSKFYENDQQMGAIP